MPHNVNGFQHLGQCFERLQASRIGDKQFLNKTAEVRNVDFNIQLHLLLNRDNNSDIAKYCSCVLVTRRRITSPPIIAESFSISPIGLLFPSL